jgi:hypothetical protein
VLVTSIPTISFSCPRAATISVTPPLILTILWLEIGVFVSSDFATFVSSFWKNLLKEVLIK